MPQEEHACIKYNDSAIVHCWLHNLKFYEVELSEFPEKCTNPQSDRDECMWGVLTCKAKTSKSETDGQASCNGCEKNLAVDSYRVYF